MDQRQIAGAIRRGLRLAWEFLRNDTELRVTLYRLLTAMAVIFTCFIACIATLGLWFVIHWLIGDMLYIADVVLLLTFLPSVLTMSFVGLVALHSDRFCNWYWRQVRTIV